MKTSVSRGELAACEMTPEPRAPRKSKEFIRQPLAENESAGVRFSPGEREGEPVLSLLLRTSIRLQKALDRCFIQFGMTAQEAAVLVRCVEAREISAGRLAESMSRDKGKITRFVDRLEAGNFLTRASDPRDRRLLIIKATSRGRRITPRLKKMFEEIRGQFFAGILTNDIDRLGFVLAQICENAGRLLDDKPPELLTKGGGAAGT